MTDTPNSPMKSRLFSIRRASFGSFLMLGLGIGWDHSDPSAALMLIFGKTVVMIGPHYPIKPDLPTVPITTGATQ